MSLIKSRGSPSVYQRDCKFRLRTNYRPAFWTILIQAPKIFLRKFFFGELTKFLRCLRLPEKNSKETSILSIFSKFFGWITMVVDVTSSVSFLILMFRILSITNNLGPHLISYSFGFFVSLIFLLITSIIFGFIIGLSLKVLNFYK